VILPALNEEGGLAVTFDDLERVRTFPGGVPPAVLVVDGHSTDRTVEIARLRGAHVLEQQGSGKGAALREGLTWARQRGFGRVGVLDADGTYPCDRLPALFQLLGEGADVVIGVRRPSRPANITTRDLVHRVGNGLLNACAAYFSGGPILDVCSGFWGTSVDVATSLELTSDGFEVESELFVKAFRRGLRVVQIPVEYRERVGEAKLRAARDGTRILLSIIHHSGDPARGADPGLRPGRRPAPASSAGGTSLPALTSVVLAFGAPRVTVFSAPSRSAEAVALARALSSATTDVEVWPLTDGSRPRERAGRPDPEPPIVAPDAVQVALPDPSWPAEAVSSVLVRAPRSRSLFLLGGEEGGRPGFLIRSPVARAARRIGVLSVLGAALDNSGIHRERAMVAANGDGRPVLVPSGSAVERRWSRAIGAVRPGLP
jgi:dolichol-phosphate mannosyltransferase